MCLLSEGIIDGLSKKRNFCEYGKCLELVIEGLDKFPARSIGKKGPLGDSTGSAQLKETTEKSLPLGNL